jgi:hypothetical protein
MKLNHENTKHIVIVANLFLNYNSYDSMATDLSVQVYKWVCRFE